MSVKQILQEILRVAKRPLTITGAASGTTTISEDVTTLNIDRLDISKATALNSTSRKKVLHDVAFLTKIGTAAGAIKITFPVSWTNCFFNIYLNLYEFGARDNTDFVINGYNIKDASREGGGYWHSYAGVRAFGPNSYRLVRFGYDSTLNKVCLLIGDTDNTWSYPEVVVTKVICGYNGYNVSTYNWKIEVVTDISNIIGLVTVNNNYIDKAYELATPRRISITGDTNASVLFSGDADVTLNAINAGVQVYGNSATPFLKVAETTVQKGNQANLVFILQYQDNTTLTIGHAKFDFKSDGTVNTSNSRLRWLISYGIANASWKFVYKKSADGNSANVQLYFNSSSVKVYITKISEADGSDRRTNLWTLYNKPTGVAALPTGYTVLTTELSPIQNRSTANLSTGGGTLTGPLKGTTAAFSGKVEGYYLNFAPPTGAANGGYIDFHFGGATGNYTSRIWEKSSGAIDCAATLSATQVYAAVYNDYAEFFPRGENTEPGDIIALNPYANNEVYVKAIEGIHSDMVVGIHSDTFGHLIGGEKVPDGLINPNTNDYYTYLDYNLPRFIPVGLTGRCNVKFIGEARKGMKVVPSKIPGVGRAYNKEIDSIEHIIGMLVESDEINDSLTIRKIKMKIKV